MRNHDVSDAIACHIARSKTLYTSADTLSCKDTVTQSEAGDISQLLIISGHFAPHQTEDDKSSQLHPAR
jgi:hypothetical protein